MADLIPRAAAVRALASSNGDYLDALERFERIPTVDAVPVVHGMWIYHDDDIMPWVSCSECDVYTDYMDKTPYCPFCGAVMDGRDSE